MLPRNKLYKKLKQTSIDSISYVAKTTMFNRYRNTLKKTIRQEKFVYYKNIFERYKHDMKKTWGIISETLNRSVPNSISDTMTINGEDCSDRQVIADSFNDYFSTIGEGNEQHIRKHNGSHFQDYLTNHTDCHFAFHLINNNDTLRIIKKIKVSKSKRHDGVSSELLKLINYYISNCITLIINQSLTSCIYPDSLKVAKVTSIHKKDDKKIISNYRPISVLPAISIVFENVIFDQLSEYFVTNNLFSPLQYGFRKISSTELTALELLDRLFGQLDKQDPYKLPH